MENSEIVEWAAQLLKAVRDITVVPIERRLWSIADIANYANKSASLIQQRVICQHDFPERIVEYKGAQPRWVAGEVIEWYESKR